MDLFDYMREKNQEKESPLASRLRPTTLDEVVGQQHIIGKDKLLYRAIRADQLQSVIFYGPPGTGKTTLARVIAHTTSAEFMQINATSAGKKDMEAVVEKAKQLQGMYQKRTILFIDEIHRFNKGQQDYLLPFVEDGTVTLIGATTENPYFEVNGALISRSIIFELKPLEAEDIRTLLLRAVTDKEKGMGAEVFNKLVVQFNPNKADMDNNQYLGLLFWILGDNPIVTKFDVCKDYVGLDMGSLYVSNAQRKRNYQYINNSEGTTHYLGDKNNNGVMIYDKTKELLNKDSKDIGYDVIRYEHRRSKFGGLHLDRLATELDCIDLPTLSAYNKLALMPKPKEDGATEIEKFDYMTFATASMILEGRIDSKELKASNRYQYKKVMEYLEDMSLANLSLSHIEIVRAIEVFAYRYQRAYAKGLKVYEDIMLNTKVVTVSEENIQRGADALIGIMERSGKGASDKLVDRLRNGKEVKVFGKDEEGNNVVVGTKRIKPTVEYTQTMLPMNDTKYF